MNIFLKTDRQTHKELLVMAAPMVVSQGAFAVMIFTDRYFMSLISPTHMAASLGGGVAAFFCLSIFNGLISYSNALVAQYFGARQYHQCTRVVTQSFILCLLSMPLLAVTTYLAGHLFVIMNHADEQVALEKSYFYILMWGCIFTLGKNALASYFSGIGRTRTVMVTDVLGVAVNIPLSYMLIFGKFGLPEMGIAGAGWGTVVSTFLSLAVFIGFYLGRHNRRQFHVSQSLVIDRILIKRYLRLGFPSGLELFLNVAAFNLFLLMFQSYGVAEGASAAIVFNWDILSFIPMTGLHIAVISLIGRFVGSGDMARANKVISAALLIGIGYSAVLALSFALFRVPLVELFITTGVNVNEIRELATFMMLGLSSYVMADALILVSGGVLRGAGDTKWLLYTSVSLHWLMLIAQYVVIKILHYSPQTSWLVFVLMLITIALVYVFRLQSGKWRHPDALKQAIGEH